MINVECWGKNRDILLFLLCLRTGTGTAFGRASPGSAAILVEVEDFGKGFVNLPHE